MKRATPNDLRVLLSASDSQVLRPWLDRQFETMTAHHHCISKFALVSGGDAISLYSEGSGRKSLAIGFCGIADMLMLPTAAMLQYFSPNCDVLVVRDSSRMGFGSGIAGYADSFAGMLRALQRDFDLDRYGNVRCFGASLGGVAALAAGVVLEADRAVSFSGHLLASAQRRRQGAPRQIEDIIQNSAGSSERFVAVFGGRNRRDRRNALAIARTFTMSLYPIRDMANHAVITALHERGRLADVLGEIGLTH